MRISTLDISGITTTVRRHEALLRFVRYLLLYNLVILLWVVITELSQMRSFEGLLESIAGLDWKFKRTVQRFGRVADRPGRYRVPSKLALMPRGTPR